MRRLLADRPRVAGFAWGFVGMFAALVLVGGGLTTYHLWTDHRAFHVMLDYLNQHADQINRLK